MFKTNAGLTEVSDHFQVLYLSGEKVRWILSKGCPVDLDETKFLQGFCAQTLLGSTNIILFCVTCGCDNDIESTLLRLPPHFSKSTSRWVCV